jgi:hypothetical protein
MKKAEFLFIFILITMSFIFASYDGVNAETKLRESPQKLNKKDIETLVKKLNFFDKELNEKGDFSNDFVDNGDGTVTDRATGLMWEQKGSKKEKSDYYVKKHVKKLNKKKFAGYNDWRIPTIEELYSLLEPNAEKGRYINPVFASKPDMCWSIDDSDLPHMSAYETVRKVTIDYVKGTFNQGYTGNPPQGASGFQIYSCFIRAVRSIK